MTLKEKLHVYCLNYAKERLARIKKEIIQSQSSANEETKSSAGDKYETGRAMAQLKVEQTTQQLMEAEKLMSTLREIAGVKVVELILPGSLVHTSQGIFYIAISLGIVEIERKNYFIISSQSPIGKLLLGKKIGDSINWNAREYIVQTIE